MASNNYGYDGYYERELNSFIDHVNDMVELAESREREYRSNYGSWYEQNDEWKEMVA